MTETAAEALLLEAVTAALHGRRLRWEPLSPALWGELFRLAETQKLLPLVADALWDCPGGEAETVLSVGKRAAMGQVTLRLGKQRRALLRAYGILED